MAQASLNIRIDPETKRAFENVCAEMGLTITTAVTVFARTVIARREIPFTIAAGDEPVSDRLLEKLAAARADTQNGVPLLSHEEFFEALRAKYGAR